MWLPVRSPGVEKLTDRDDPVVVFEHAAVGASECDLDPRDATQHWNIELAGCCSRRQRVCRESHTMPHIQNVDFITKA